MMKRFLLCLSIFASSLSRTNVLVSALNLRGSSNSNSDNGQLHLTDDDDLQFYQELYSKGEITEQFFEQLFIESERHRGVNDDTTFDEYGDFIGDDDYVRDNLESKNYRGIEQEDAIVDEYGEFIGDDDYVRENIELQPMQLQGMRDM
ncbi:predicted protein [Chaetoceros tenuissimus]|uniref:Calmodulin n=1 Tax=Chaetoceros tenuissimus TaxID=426638 RepID=A0AAD3CZX0_9STRA|nr:predicted protein [Chaetoceros tenuissimus]